MSDHSGKFGVVNGQSTVFNWAFDRTTTLQRGRASNTNNGSARRKGIKDWKGSFSNYLAIPTVLPGDIFAFKGFTAPDDDGITSGSDVGVCYEGNAIIDSVVITWNWETGALLQTVHNFSGHGPYTKTSAEYTDDTDPEMPSVLDCAKWEFVNMGPEGAGDSAGSGDDSWDEIVSATLTITADNVTKVNSSTAGWTERKAGPIDWTLQVVMDDNDTDSIGFDQDDNLALKLYVDDTQFWHLKWGMVGEFTGLVVDNDTGALIRQTANISMNGFPPELLTGGAITLPGAASNWWEQS